MTKPLVINGTMLDRLNKLNNILANIRSRTNQAQVKLTASVYIADSYNMGSFPLEVGDGVEFLNLELTNVLKLINADISKQVLEEK